MEVTAAVVRERGGSFQVERVELAGPEAGEVLVRVAASGICQTDVHARDGYFPTPFPAVYGHEGAGIVERIGDGVEKVKPCGRQWTVCVLWEPAVSPAAAGKGPRRAWT
jgi:aryl-alcohol dehydrogenase